MINVYAFPPVLAVASEWTSEQPVQRSRSLVTGADYISAMGRRRRLATVIVSALAGDRSGAGYSEVLKRYLDGGMNAVRLSSRPVNWHLDHNRMEGLRSLRQIEWTSGGDTFTWTSGGVPFVWATGTIITVASVVGDTVTVTGLPASTLVARPGEFVEAFELLGSVDGDVGIVRTVARSDASGQAVLKLMEPLPGASYARVNIGAAESAVFRAEGMPRAVQPMGQNWTYEWRFREVFSDEVGGFTEVNPWR